ncbi:unnamed protein product [Camellia sinensis]
MLKRSFLARNTTSTQPSSNGYPSPHTPTTQNTSFPGKTEADVVVIGSGIAGLCCAGLLSKYQQDALVLESHSLLGGAAHSFEKKGYKFDSGPSLFSGFQSRGPQANPLAQVLDALGESIPCVNYDSWMVYLPEGSMQVLMLGENGENFLEWYKPGCSLEYPIHGTGAVVDALVCGLQKFVGRISFKSHVENIVVENGRAVGVKLRSGQFVRAKKAVVSNASMRDTLDLLPKEVIPKSYQDRIKMTPQCESFMHLHLGFDAEGISDDLKIRHTVVNDWERGADADQNVVLISIPSVLSPDLAPPGKHVLHAYMSGTEPFGLWEDLIVKVLNTKNSKLKDLSVLWRAVERAVGPGFDREKCEVKLVGTPLTHRRFLRRNRGSYGPVIQASKGTFPGHSTLIPQLYCCGDSTFPGIEVPAVAASGAIVANSLVSVSQRSELLDAVGK